ncbi:IS256 family transposase [Lewinella lacunae]|uniref:Mutator family transposase n=2 Tax=Neolewinella lacunae TaxID=1517758 RepID=A0A923PN52_9BACT|nr:IS256 family transposase [Neolewinella lacunae]MBC6994266.1 IS256 family transposase [Neolewinella lacunae]MBC6994354.1 IS256 family transposase [Neolewinella lacunae]MBC6994892.1 IS256 family transposase [Neolewinella lacunae]
MANEKDKTFADFESDIITGLMSGKPLGGTEGVLTGLIKHVIEKSMNAELREHLELEANNPDALPNKRNGRANKKVNTDFGPTEISPSRDRMGTYESAIVGKWQHDLAPNMSQQILSLYARGNSYQDISNHLHEMFGHVISPASITGIVNEVWDDVQAWQKRALQTCYVAVFMDAIHFNIRLEGKSTSVATYLFYGVDVHGYRDILSMYTGRGAESTSQWSVLLADLKERGAEDIKVFIADGLPGLVDAVGTYFPASRFQRCIVHKVRNSVVGVDFKDRREVCKDLRSVYTAMDEDGAVEALKAFELKWDKYPHVVRLWQKDWTELMVFMSFGPQMRRLIYTTNALENVNRHLRKATKSKGSWPSTKSLMIQVYLTLQATKPAWAKTVRNFAAVQRELMEEYGEEYTKYLEC